MSKVLVCEKCNVWFDDNEDLLVRCKCGKVIARKEEEQHDEER